ncbi:MAG: caspase family protein [Sulfitobacter sp.]
MRIIFNKYLMVAAVFLATVVGANAQDRKAFVIGINKYPELQNLTRATADAKAMAESLGGWGFDVTLKTDIMRSDFFQALTLFTANIENGDDVVFFFSGHGISIDRENYLLMSDAPAVMGINEVMIKNEAISMQFILNLILKQGASSAIIIIDACRDNPYGTLAGDDIGLTAMSPSDRSFIFTSASEGQTALDRLTEGDPHPNSVFTRILLEELQNGARSIEDIAKKVRQRVRNIAQEHGHEQVPDYIPRLATDFRFDATPIREETSREPEPLVSGCTSFATALPLHSIDTDFLDISGQGQHLSFGGAATVCVEDQMISITAGQTRTIPCLEVLDGEHSGLGHTFFTAGKAWRFWFFIPKDSSSKTLQIGLYEGLSGDDPLYWIETGAPICNS